MQTIIGPSEKRRKAVRPGGESATARHDYARIWRGLKPAERDRRLTQALARLAEGETLSQVGATWSISAPSLCRALLAYAPVEWRGAMAARAMLRYQEATDRHAADPGNPIARAQAWASRWHLDYALKKLCNTSLTVRGQEYIGKCPGCGARNVYARIGAEARCYGCEWTGEAKRYLLDQLQTPATVAANN